MSFRTILLTPTSAGLDALGSANNQDVDLKITHVVIGAGLTALDGTSSTLTDERERVTIASAAKLDNAMWEVLALFDDDPSANYSVTEIGLIGDGVLFAHWVAPSASEALVVRQAGTPFELTIPYGFAALPSENITFIVDPGASQASQVILQHEASANPHGQYVRKDTLLTGVNKYSDTEKANAQVNIGLTIETAIIPTNFQGWKINLTQPHWREFIWNGTAYVRAPSQPCGIVVYDYAGGTAPDGWLAVTPLAVHQEADVPDLAKRLGIALGASFSFVDLRGEFLRIWDDGRGVDQGRVIKSTQQASRHASIQRTTGHVNTVWSDSVRVVIRGGTAENQLQSAVINGGALTVQNTVWGNVSLFTTSAVPRNIALQAIISK